MNYSLVVLGGRLTRDPEVSYAKGDGMAIVKCSVAWSSGIKEKKRSNFIDVTLFGKRGEAFAKFHSKGSQCLIQGELRMDQWEDKQTGAKRSRISVIGNEWQFVGSKQDRPAGETAPDGAENVGFTDPSDPEIPF